MLVTQQNALHAVYPDQTFKQRDGWMCDSKRSSDVLCISTDHPRQEVIPEDHRQHRHSKNARILPRPPHHDRNNCTSLGPLKGRTVPMHNRPYQWWVTTLNYQFYLNVLQGSDRPKNCTLCCFFSKGSTGFYREEKIQEWKTLPSHWDLNLWPDTAQSRLWTYQSYTNSEQLQVTQHNALHAVYPNKTFKQRDSWICDSTRSSDVLCISTDHPRQEVIPEDHRQHRHSKNARILPRPPHHDRNNCTSLGPLKGRTVLIHNRPYQWWVTTLNYQFYFNVLQGSDCTR